jgi:hypothetical protein
MIFSEGVRFRTVSRLACVCAIGGTLLAFQRAFRKLNGIEYRMGEIPVPPDFKDPQSGPSPELMFPPGPPNGYRGRDLDWHTGISLWSHDFPRAACIFCQGDISYYR